MAKILDPDSLTYLVNGSPTTQNLRINTSTKRIRLVAGGSLVAADGVTLQCVYSKLKEVWKTDATAVKHPFPMDAIHDESMEMVSGWDWEDDTTRKMIRDGGWAVRNTAGNITQMWACIVTLGTVLSGAPYFTQSSATNATTSAFTYCAIGQAFGINEAVQIYRDDDGDGVFSEGSDFDRRTYFKVFLREYAKTYDEADNTAIGYPSLTYKKYNFPITHSADPNVINDDTFVDGANAPYNGMSLQWYAAAQSRSLGTNGPYNYHVVIDGNAAQNATYQEVYTFVQRQLRKTSDIDAGAGNRTGAVTPALVFMDGATLKTIYQAGVGGVHIDNLAASSYNNVAEADDTQALRTYPFTASLTIEFDAFLVSDAGPAKYWVYFTNDDAGNNAGADFGTDNAILVQDGSGVDMTGNVTGASVSKSFNYDSNVQRGAASAGDDAPVTVVALGLATAKWGKGTGTIQRSTSNKVVVQPGLERNYVNP